MASLFFVWLAAPIGKLGRAGQSGCQQTVNQGLILPAHPFSSKFSMHGWICDVQIRCMPWLNLTWCVDKMHICLWLVTHALLWHVWAFVWEMQLTFICITNFSSKLQSVSVHHNYIELPIVQFAHKKICSALDAEKFWCFIYSDLRLLIAWIRPDSLQSGQEK